MLSLLTVTVLLLGGIYIIAGKDANDDKENNNKEQET